MKPIVLTRTSGNHQSILRILNIEPACLHGMPSLPLQAGQAGIEIYLSTTILHFPFISLWLKIAAT